MTNDFFIISYRELYLRLTEIARVHGYALAIHGLLCKNMEFMCVPWAVTVSTPEELIEDISNKFTAKVKKETNAVIYGKDCLTISIDFGTCSVKLMFTPRNASVQGDSHGT